MEIINGNIFTSQCQTFVNTINCVGIMGAGIALEFRLRYPEMYWRYQRLCRNRKLDIGILWLYKEKQPWVLNFPTKRHWKHPSKTSYLHKGLQKFVDTYQQKGILSAAFPLLGASKGGIASQEVLRIMGEYLENLDIEIEIYTYDPMAYDDLFEQTKAWVKCQSIEDLVSSTGIRKQQLRPVLNGFCDPGIRQLNQLGRMSGVGVKTLEKVFHVARNKCGERESVSSNQQRNLFL